MSVYLPRVHELLDKHYGEVQDGGIVDKPPSRLARGEGVAKSFFILKIDLVGSTMMLSGRHNETYLKLVHSYLSTVDRITQDFGADPQQMEYAGDGLLAYFEESDTTTEKVLASVCYSMEAVNQLQALDTTLGNMKPRCKVVVHFAKLVVARIGPRANSLLTAIGHPIHYVSKVESSVAADTGRVTKEFREKVRVDWRKYLSPVYDQSPLPAPFSPSPQSNRLAELLCPPVSPMARTVANTGVPGLLSHSSLDAGRPGIQQQILADVLRNFPPTPIVPAHASIDPPARNITGYDIRRAMLLHDLENSRARL